MAEAQHPGSRESSGSREPFFNMGTRRDLFLKIVSGLVTGLLVAFATSQLQSALEETKRSEAMWSELARLRIERVAEVSSEMGETENAIRLFLLSHEHLEEKRQGPNAAPTDELKRLDAEKDSRFRKAKAAIEKFLSVLSRNRFWIGDSAYEIIRSHVSTLGKELTPPIDPKRMDEQMSRTRPTLDRIFPQLTRELDLLKHSIRKRKDKGKPGCANTMH